jgi:hypothetical protein
MKNSKKIISIIFLFALVFSIFSFNIKALSSTGSSYLHTLESKFAESSSYRTIIKNIDKQKNTAVLHFNNGEVHEFEIASDALLVRQNRIQDIGNFNTGDSVISLIDAEEKIRFIETINNNLFKDYTLEDLGYNDNILLKENKAEMSFFFPLNEKVKITESVLSYYLRFSPLLRDDSTINITVEDQILFSGSLADIKNNTDYQGNNITALITLNLSNLENINLSNKKFINSTINADIKISDNRCDDINNSSLWMNILNKSQIRFKHKTFVDYDINEFFSGNFNNLNIYLPENIDEVTAEALLKLRIYLSRNFQHLNINLLKKTDFDNKYLYNYNSRNIFIENQSQKIKLDRNLNLFLGSKSAAAFINPASETFAADNINIKSFTNNKSSQEDYLSFKDLGYSTFNFRGIGEITKTVNFTNADLGRRPENIRLILKGVYTPPQKLKAVENNNSYLKIYLNQELIRVHQLSENGEIDNLPIELPSSLLNQENNLSFAYSYYPIGNDCAADGQYFEGTIADRSYLELKGSENEEYVNFDNILTKFSSQGVLLLPNDNRFFYLKNAAETLASFRKLDKQPTNINVNFIKQSAEPELNEEDNWIFAVLPTSDYLNLNIPFEKIGERLEVQSTLNENDEQLKEKFLLEAEIDNEFASWQLFKRDGKAYSLISASNQSSNAQRQIENLSSSVKNTAAFRNLEGNLLISSNSKLHNISLLKEEDEIVINQWKIFYQNYRLVILVLLLVIILIAAYWIYKNMAKMPEDK